MWLERPLRFPYRKRPDVSYAATSHLHHIPAFFYTAPPLTLPVVSPNTRKVGAWRLLSTSQERGSSERRTSPHAMIVDACRLPARRALKDVGFHDTSPRS